ncbi:MAG: MG2 domain-containing protein [Myxococcota bacterium]
MSTPTEVTAPSATAEAKTVPAEKAPPATKRLELEEEASSQVNPSAIRSYFEGQNAGRIYIQTDKPLYKPGETVWFRGWALDSKTFAPRSTASHVYELVSPKGSTVLTKRVKADGGATSNDFEIPEGVQGGEYKIKVQTSDGLSGEREIVVSTYEAPRIKKKLEFMRKAYGAGDTVKATIEVKRPTGAPLADHPLRPVGTLEGRPLDIAAATTNARGEATVSFTLPTTINKADGLLSIMVEDGGITESISKRIPIVLKKVQMGFFPEGGDLVEGMESRLYFEAKNSIGKPADVSGEIVDDLGNAVARFETYHKGLGRVRFTPSSGRSYRAKISKPVGVTETYALPLPKAEGCTLRTYDDLDGELSDLRLRVACSEEQDVVVVGTLRDTVMDIAKVRAGPDGATVYLKGDTRQGTARVTVFDGNYAPLAERIVFRNRRAGLNVAVRFDRERYAPRDPVEMTVTTKTADGEPVAAEVGVSVVDDTVISFADDKTGHMTARLLLESEIPGKIEEPKFFLDLKEEKSALALELLMGTRGYRKFSWNKVGYRPEPSLAMDGMRGGAAPKGVRFRAMAAPPMVGAAKPIPEGRAEAPADQVLEVAQPAPKPDMKPARELGRLDDILDEELAPEAEAEPDFEFDDDDDEDELLEAPPVAAQLGDKDWAAADLFAKEKKLKAEPWAVVREFPLPSYTGELSGTRSDFRETIFWSPSISTGESGEAKVRFFLNDAVTSFRVFAEGAGGESVGRKEETFESSLPFSLNVKLPLEVSAGDKPRLPLTLSNERDVAASVGLTASFGDLLTLDGGTTPPGELGAKERASLFYPLTVTGARGESEVRISATSAGLKDEIIRQVKVVPRGFPRIVAGSGTLAKTAVQSLDLKGAVPGTARAQVTVYPSITATLVSGLEGMLREPYGCFEQTSSTNYPNVLVMDYLQSSGQADVAVMARASDLIEKGYKRLVSFETEQKGYEWFGSTPAHEALTAYGVLEFTDMKRVYGGVDDAMLTRTINYLEKRRDGKGGFLRDAQALDSFGRADPAVTNAYITYAVAEAGYGERFTAEVNALAAAAKNGSDPYILALAANTLLSLPKKTADGRAILDKLMGLQKPDGSFDGTSHSITRSSGKNLSVETTGLAVLAMLKSEGNLPRAQKAVSWLSSQRQYGAFGATQATVMALRAMTAFGQAASKAQGPGNVTLKVNGKEVGTQAYQGGQSDALVFSDFDAFLTDGENTFELIHRGEAEIPFEMAVEYFVEHGQDHPEAGLALQTAIAKDALKMGETVRLTATIENTEDAGRPMTLARIGLPGGLTFQTWQLKELRENGTIDFYETKAREVILYFRQMEPKQRVEVPIELVATVPGEYTSPASRTYLYYTDDKKVWAEPISVAIQP